MSSTELRATYRLQLTPSFGFAAARELVPYLRDLGISHLYLSPSLQARSGSAHGYDVVDPSRLSSALGGREGFDALAAAVRGAGMGIVLDVVPNHMGIGDQNRFWTDPALRSRFFDVDPFYPPPPAPTARWRRFFDIDDLAGVRVESLEVFEATHGLVLDLVREGSVDGLRVDHPDGLLDPLEYLQRLRAGGAGRVWVEKILGSSERLPASWPVSGSVGYEFLNDVCALFVDPGGLEGLTSLWASVSGSDRPFGSWALEAKLSQARGAFAPEVERLARAAESEPFFASLWVDTTHKDAQNDEIALALASLPVYRTYDPPSSGEYTTRFQQTSPAIMAKGVEDTAFYRYARLLALNDVGGDPGRWGVSVADFHARNAERAVRYPEGLLTTMTHDAKRSADVRARIVALSGMADEWVELWSSVRSDDEGPDPIDRYFIVQTLIGVWPIEFERLDGYIEKALREAKRNSNWTEPDVGYEDAAKAWTRRLLHEPEFLKYFEPLLARVTADGGRISLAWLVLKLTSPGVPDTYQGDELEFRALVDPDNRRPVDFELRRERLAFLEGGGRPGADLGDRKLWVTARLLGLRSRDPEPFAGAYEPVDMGERVCAFVRGGRVLTAVSLDGRPLPDPGAGWRELLDVDPGVGVYQRV
jgi:(1->4)-alpha-D-glucan 1-alpha-D-glucosylmutase